nr:hypothetical protein [uncultured Gemmiger sp.]
MNLRIWFAAARRHPFGALYLLGVLLLVLSMVGSFALDGVLYALGVYEEKTVTLADTDQYTLVNMEEIAPGVLTSTTGDAQLLLTPGTLVRRLRLVAEYTGDGGEKDLYYHLPGMGYTPRLRVWPTAAPDGESWTYTLPRTAGQNLRLDLADTSGVEVQVTALLLNERPAWTTYFVPGGWQLFWLAVLPGLAGCLLTLRRDDR